MVHDSFCDKIPCTIPLDAKDTHLDTTKCVSKSRMESASRLESSLTRRTADECPSKGHSRTRCRTKENKKYHRAAVNLHKHYDKAGGQCRQPVLKGKILYMSQQPTAVIATPTKRFHALVRKATKHPSKVKNIASSGRLCSLLLHQRSLRCDRTTQSAETF